MNFHNDCYNIVKQIKTSAYFPVDTGTLKDHFTNGRFIKNNEFEILFNAPYVGYLEEGTDPHDIPHAFGYGTIYKDRPNPYTGKIPFGVGGRFDGKFHPGSHLHKGFISIDSVRTVIDYFVNKYNGVLK